MLKLLWDRFDWTFLFACISWGSLTALMLYVKLRKKIESFPVLVLILLLMAYMNSGDLLAKRFKLYTIACVNRRVYATQFLASLMLGFASNSFPDILVAILCIAAIMARTDWSIGKAGFPVIGSFLMPSPLRKSLVFLGIAFQCLGFFTGSVLSVAMIDDQVTTSFPLRSATVPNDFALYHIPITLAIMLVLSKKLLKVMQGQIQTALASGLLASLSRIVPIYSSSPLILVPVLMVISRAFPGAITSITTFLPKLTSMTSMTGSQKFRAFCSVMVWHIGGALIANYACDYFLPSDINVDEIPYVPKRAIAQEFFFSVLIGLVGNTVPSIAFAAGWLASGGSGDLAHLSSSISFGSFKLDEGRLLARIIWQIAGSLLGATWITSFADSEKIDFNPLISVTRTTDGKRVREQ